MASFNLKNLIKKSWLILLIMFFFTINVFADNPSGNLPFNTTIDSFQDNFVAWIAVAVVLLWIATTLMLAFGEWGDGMKRMLNILFWIALCLSGVTVVPLIFGSGAVV